MVIVVVFLIIREKTVTFTTIIMVLLVSIFTINYNLIKFIRRDLKFSQKINIKLF